MKILKPLMVALFLCLNAEAQLLNDIVQKELSCTKNGLTVLYINGQENSKPEAENSRFRIKELFQTVYGYHLLVKEDFTQNVNFVRFSNVHNPTLGQANGTALADFARSIALIFQSEFGLSREKAWVAGYAFFQVGMTVNQIKKTFGADIVIDARIQALLDDPYQKLLSAEAQVSQELRDKILEITETEERKLIIISHSQGNLFTNNTVLELKDSLEVDFISRMNTTGNVQVASPAQQIQLHKSLHVTNHEDAILKLDSIPGYSPLQPNFTLEKPNPDYREDQADRSNNHGFISTYLIGQQGGDYADDTGNGNLKELKEFVIQSIVDVASSLESNCGIPPVPNFTYRVRTGNSMVIEFDGGSSTDEDDLIEKYEWLFFGQFITTGKTTALLFSQEGFFPITLQVTDEAGNVRGITIPITVYNPPPIAAFTSSISNLTATFNASISSDENGSITQYTWDFGDFTSATSTSPNMSHTYAAPGQYAVILTVTDNHGKTSIEFKNIDINPGVQVFANFDRTVGVNGMIFDATNSFQLPAGPLQYKWKFSDGIEGNGEVFTRNFDTEGTYTATLTVTGSGGVKATRSQTFSVLFNVTTGPFTYTGTMIAFVNISQMPDGTYIMAFYIGGTQYVATWTIDGQVVVLNQQGFNSGTAVYNFTKPSTPVSICLTDPNNGNNGCTNFNVLRSYQ